MLAAYEKGLKGDGSVWGPEYHLFDLAGNEITFANGITPDSCVFNGILRIAHESGEEERAAHPSGWGTVYGLAKPDGTVIVEPQYDYLEFAGDGMVSVYLDGCFGVIDLSGNVIVPPRYHMNWGGPLPSVIYRNGYAVIDEEKEDRCLIIDKTGCEIVSIPNHQPSINREDFRFYSITSPAENGCFWVHSWMVNRESSYPRKENDAYELMRITDGQAVKLTETAFESIADGIADAACEQIDESFAEGMQAVCLNGLWGYIDENGQTVIPFQWEGACNFYHGLALVEKNGKLSYIDHDGVIVWQEK